jgi:hypothetical protein
VPQIHRNRRRISKGWSKLLNSRNVGRTLLALGVIAGAITIPAAPAFAAQVSCVIANSPKSTISCSTGYAPGTTTKIAMSVYPVSSGTITCRAYDQGGNERAALSNPARGRALIGNFTVPSSKYFMVCIRPTNTTGGSGWLYDTHFFG